MFIKNFHVCLMILSVGMSFSFDLFSVGADSDLDAIEQATKNKTKKALHDLAAHKNIAQEQLQKFIEQVEQKKDAFWRYRGKKNDIFGTDVMHRPNFPLGSVNEILSDPN